MKSLSLFIKYVVLTFSLLIIVGHAMPIDYSKIQGKYLNKLLVNDIVQDESGRLWLATYSGLYYQDGEKPIKNNLGNSEIDSGIIWDLEKYKENLFIATNKNLYIYNYSSGRVDKVKLEKEMNLSLFRSANNEYYAKHGSVIFKFNESNSKLERFLTLSEKVLHASWLDGVLYISTREGVFVYRGKNKVLKISSEKIDFFERLNGTIYYFSEEKVFIEFDGITQPVSLIGETDSCVGRVKNAVKFQGSIWFASELSGICILDLEHKTVKKYRSVNKQGPEIFRSASGLTKDKLGGVLYLTSDGVLYFSPKMKKMSIQKDNDYELLSLLYSTKSKDLYILTRNYILKKNRDGTYLKIHQHDPVINFMIRDGAVYYLSVSNPKKLVKFDFDNIELSKLNLPEPLYYFLDIKETVVTYNSDGSLLSFNYKDGAEEPIYPLLKERNAPFALTESWRDGGLLGCDFNGKVLISNVDGVKKIDLTQPNLNIEQVCTGFVKGEGSSYFLNSRSGLYKYESESLTFVRDVDETWIKLYKLENALLSTYNSKLNIFYYNNNKYMPIDLSIYDIGHIDYFSKPVFFDNNTFALAYGNGIAHVDLDILNTRIKNQFIYLRDFKVDDEKLRLTNDINLDNYNNTANVQQLVPYEHELVKLKLTNPNYYDDVHIKFRYRLKGYKDDWQTATKEKYEVTFVSLPPDDYLFEAQASFNGGPWVANTKLRFSVETPFWLTWWAYCIYVVSILAMVYGIVRLRTRTLEKRAEKLEHEISLRTEEVQQQKLTIEQLLDRKNKMFANISHEIRTPLTLIISPIKAYLSEPKGKLATTLLHSVLTNAQRLHHLVEQSLEIARLEMKGDTSLVTIELSSFAQLAVEQFHSLAESKRINMKASCSSSVYVLATKESIEILLYNLLSNAIKYTPEGGDVYLEIQVIKEDVLLTVEDSGEGIPQAERSKVFERFTRLEQHQDKEGTGLGLALVKETVESLQGEVDISRSSSLGGCLIKVTLPLATYNDNAVSAISLNGNLGSLDEMGSRSGLVTTDTMTDFVEEKPASDKSNSIESGSIDLQSVDKSRSVGAQESRPQVLVIEDNNELRRFIVDILEGDFHCLTAKDGLEGTAIALEQVPDLIISDLMMPHKDGIEVARTLRTDMRTSHIPIILLTAKSDIDTRHKAWQSDIDEFIAKPFEHQELIARCRNLLSIRQLLSERLKASAAVSTQGIASEGLDASQKHLAGVPEKDRQFIHSLESYVADHYHDSQLQMPVTAAALHMSEKQLQRKVRSLLNQSFSEYLRNYRLKIAAEKLKQGHSASEVAFDVGFSSGSYFSTCFKAYFGLTPKNYVEANKN